MIRQPNKAWAVVGRFLAVNAGWLLHDDDHGIA
jgi:hypothetical protein